MTITRVILGIYVALCVFGLFVLGSGTFGWFGVERDPLSAAFAVLLAMPWMLLFTSQDFGPALGLMVVLIGMLLNAAIIVGLGRVFRRLFGTRRGARSGDEVP